MISGFSVQGKGGKKEIYTTMSRYVPEREGAGRPIVGVNAGTKYSGQFNSFYF